MKLKTEKADKCAHKSCAKCGGTGLNKYTGQQCIHWILCGCILCNPTYDKLFKLSARAGGENGI